MTMQAIAEKCFDLSPHSIESEMCLLASMMLDRNCIVEVSALVKPGSFFQQDHAKIFSALLDLHRQDKPVDAVMLREALVRCGQLDEIGGVAYLAEILNSVPSAAHAIGYAETVREKATLRGALTVAYDIVRKVGDASRWDRSEEIIHSGAAALATLLADSSASDTCTIEQAVHEVFEQMERGETPLVRTGVNTIDQDMGGLGLGETLVIAARPSMGKSLIGREIAASAAMLDTPTLIVSMEENRHKIARNLLAATSGLENGRLRRGGTFTRPELEQLTGGVAKLAGLPLFIIDDAFTTDTIRARVAAHVVKYGIRIVVVDYLQLASAPGKTLYERATNASLDLTRMAKELRVAEVLLAQLSRAVIGRDNKRPGMSDIRESGWIEQNADQILGLHREDYYRATGESSEDSVMDGKVELIKLKFRDGCRGGAMLMKSDLPHQWFHDWEIDVPFSEPMYDPASR